MKKERELSEIVNSIKYQIRAIIRKININYQYIDSDDLYQEILLYLWQEKEKGQLKDKNDSYILQGCYYYLKNYIRKNLKTVTEYPNKVYPDREALSREIKDETKLINKYGNNYILDEYLYLDEFSKELSIKEKVLLDFRMKGLTDREIAKELGISHTMVSKMRRKIRQKYQFYYE
ncbi:MAG: sigma-70 family RNA polymerase sigma factor [Atribacterota bacterium]|nr:sigma-70 family RNA polymerase sigma factor [Atribacterota bacterium]MDD4895225.1 sigma-70 family RNA polymerase sigma factor [Atribacterota bacterium]MDD5637013.1 sigma-70 family RNA polymerase sigma factor [Atribacterota bacterium]